MHCPEVSCNNGNALFWKTQFLINVGGMYYAKINYSFLIKLVRCRQTYRLKQERFETITSG